MGYRLLISRSKILMRCGSGKSVPLICDFMLTHFRTFSQDLYNKAFEESLVDIAAVAGDKDQKPLVD
jgi:hypothetical protein